MNGFAPKRVLGTKVIITLHDVLPLTMPKYFTSKKAEAAYRHRVRNDIDGSDLLLTVSEFSKKEILRNFNVKVEPVVIHYAPTLDASGRLPASPDGNNQDYFLYVGGYGKRKVMLFPHNTSVDTSRSCVHPLFRRRSVLREPEEAVSQMALRPCSQCYRKSVPAY